ncbi:hypothetical protein ACSBR2_002964 [Camellia fascicularis]
MDRYQRVEKPRPETPIKNEIRITRQGRIRNYIIYATALFQILNPFGDGLCLYLLDMLCIEKGIRDNCFHEVAFPCFKTSTPRLVYIEATRAAVDARFVSNDLQDTWEELDLDELSYEELLALGEVVRTESRRLSSDTIASLPSVNYKTQSTQNGNNDLCVIYRLDYEDGDTLTGKKLAVCSAATKSSVVLCLENLIGIERFKSLDCFLAGDDVKEKKPDPSIYLTAAKKLGLSAKECLVVEDSVIGLQCLVMVMPSVTCLAIES